MWIRLWQSHFLYFQIGKTKEKKSAQQKTSIVIARAFPIMKLFVVQTFYDSMASTCGIESIARTHASCKHARAPEMQSPEYVHC